MTQPLQRQGPHWDVYIFGKERAQRWRHTGAIFPEPAPQQAVQCPSTLGEWTSDRSDTALLGKVTAAPSHTTHYQALRVLVCYLHKTPPATQETHTHTSIIHIMNVGLEELNIRQRNNWSAQRHEHVVYHLTSVPNKPHL